MARLRPLLQKLDQIMHRQIAHRSLTQRCRLVSSLGVRRVEDVNQQRKYSSTRPALLSKDEGSGPTVTITYVEADGSEQEVQAEIGQNLLDVAHDNNVELEGACGGELACSTCHLIFPQDVYDTLPEKTEEEEDMLDLALELTDTSRLGCQVLVREDFEGLKVQIPDDGF